MNKSMERKTPTATSYPVSKPISSVKAPGIMKNNRDRTPEGFKRQLTSYNGEGPSQMSKVMEIQKILNQNNDKR